MDVRLIFLAEIAGNILVFALVARWYLWRRLDRLPLKEALVPLLLFHGTRTVGLTMIVPGVVDPTLPRDFANPAAYGDLLAAALAMAAVAALRMNLGMAPIVAWAFTVEGVADLFNAIIQGIRIDLTSYELGAVWFIFTVLVPALLVTHFLIAAALVRNGRAAAMKRSPSAELP